MQPLSGSDSWFQTTKNSALVLDVEAAHTDIVTSQGMFLKIVHNSLKVQHCQPKRVLRLRCIITYSARVTSPCAFSGSVVIPKCEFCDYRFTASRELKIGLSADCSRQLWTQI